ncbi:hypothetical protein HDU91_001291, partial [Kappamyces sp. JEL0680]
MEPVACRLQNKDLFELGWETALEISTEQAGWPLQPSRLAELQDAFLRIAHEGNQREILIFVSDYLIVLEREQNWQKWRLFLLLALESWGQLNEKRRRGFVHDVLGLTVRFCNATAKELATAHVSDLQLGFIPKVLGDNAAVIPEESALDVVLALAPCLAFDVRVSQATLDCFLDLVTAAGLTASSLLLDARIKQVGVLLAIVGASSAARRTRFGLHSVDLGQADPYLFVVDTSAANASQAIDWELCLFETILGNASDNGLSLSQELFQQGGLFDRFVKTLLTAPLSQQSAKAFQLLHQLMSKAETFSKMQVVMHLINAPVPTLKVASIVLVKEAIHRELVASPKTRS